MTISVTTAAALKHAQKRARLSLAASRLFSASAAAKSSVKPLANLQAFEQAVNSSKGAIVDFHAEWCGPCKLVSPIFAQLAEQNKELAFYSVDVDRVPDVAAACEIQAMPTFLAFRNGEAVDGLKGAAPAVLKSLVAKQAEAAKASS